MTKEQAIAEMQTGSKITHRYFSNDEFITMESGKIVTEEGYKVSTFEFWRWRTDDEWNDGYSLFNEQ